MDKKELRQIMLEKRKNILNKEEKSTIIVEKIKKLNILKKSQVIALYKRMKDEVSLEALIDDALMHQKVVLLPKIMDKQMVFIEINEKTKYQKSNFNVWEPISDKIYDGQIDLMLIPGVCFDKKNNRLGFGKGYYDKYLGQKDTYKIGICFKEQIIDSIPKEEWDIPMDLIIHN